MVAMENLAGRFDLPLIINQSRERSKKIKKLLTNPWVCIVSPKRVQMPAVTDRYGKGGWPQKPTEPVASNGEKQLAESLNPQEIRANEIDTESL